ncbi:MAG: cell wall-binding repeat-containing protein [Actinomycetota bacterium]|nr:cell wall-binding repeat-containing protein [Actinomycetota bacterium]
MPAIFHVRRLLVVLAIVAVGPVGPAHADDPSLWFPQQLPVQFTDTWGEARASGRTHTGTDIMGAQMDQVYAAASGVIRRAAGEDCTPGTYCSSFSLLINGDDGHSYFYVHLNNDTPGRPQGCDGLGGADGAFAPRLVDVLRRRGTLEGVRVERGEHVAYVGSSGNAPCGVDHTHFEIWHGHDWGSPKINPYPALRAAFDAGRVWDAEGAPPPPGRYDRVAGRNRIETAVALSQHSFSSATTVVIAPANFHVEPLAAAPLAAKLGGPVLTVWAEGPDVVPQVVADEIGRLGATRAVLVGTPERLSSDAERELVEEAGLAAAHLRRIAGSDPFEVAGNVAREVLQGASGPVSPLLALGSHSDPNRSWPDALAGSVVAARQGVPVLLTREDRLPDATRQLLARADVSEVRIVGGHVAIDPAVEDEVRVLGHATRRVFGPTRHETSLRLAEELLGAGTASAAEVYVATGGNFPDAVAAGPAVARTGHVLVLADGADADLQYELWPWLRDRAAEIETVHAVGGTAAVSDPVLRRVASFANWPR